MTPKQLAILIIGCFGIAFAAMLFTARPAKAVEPMPIPLPCQEPQDTIEKETKGLASRFVFHEVETLNADAIMYFEAFDMVWRVYVRKGCMITTPAVIDYAKNRGEPA